MKKSIGPKTIVYPTPVFIIGTYDKDGNPNAMNAAWAGICCSAPPCVAVSLRKATHTYSNIMEQQAFTVSIPSQDFIREADYFGIVSGRDINKFSQTGLTPEKSEFVNAPYVKEFPFALECMLLHNQRIGLHTLFIGRIMDVKVDETVLGDGDVPDITKVKPMIYSTSDQSYYGLGPFLGKAFKIGKEIEKKV